MVDGGRRCERVLRESDVVLAGVVFGDLRVLLSESCAFNVTDERLRCPKVCSCMKKLAVVTILTAFKRRELIFYITDRVLLLRNIRCEVRRSGLSLYIAGGGDRARTGLSMR